MLLSHAASLRRCRSRFTRKGSADFRWLHLRLHLLLHSPADAAERKPRSFSNPRARPIRSASGFDLYAPAALELGRGGGRIPVELVDLRGQIPGHMERATQANGLARAETKAHLASTSSVGTMLIEHGCICCCCCCFLSQLASRTHNHRNSERRWIDFACCCCCCCKYRLGPHLRYARGSRRPN